MRIAFIRALGPVGLLRAVVAPSLVPKLRSPNPVVRRQRRAFDVRSVRPTTFGFGAHCKDQQGCQPERRMVNLGRVSRSGFYRFDDPEPRPDPDIDLRDAIQKIAVS